ncbi:MAG: general secretion pathway protein GspB [bacterium]
MSFLLDAIRKAEKQRNEDTVPSLEAIVGERRQRSKSRQGGWLVWVALVIAVVATGYLSRNHLSNWWQQAAKASHQSIDKLKNSLGNIVSIEVSDTSAPNTTTGQDNNSSDNQSGSQKTSGTPEGSQLTNAQRALLSKIEFSVISYSDDPDKRFAMVGSQILREGDRLEGFPITRIQADGVVIDVSGKAVLIRP